MSLQFQIYLFGLHTKQTVGIIWHVEAAGPESRPPVKTSPPPYWIRIPIGKIQGSSALYCSPKDLFAVCETISHIFQVAIIIKRVVHSNRHSVIKTGQRCQLSLQAIQSR